MTCWLASQTDFVVIQRNFVQTARKSAALRSVCLKPVPVVPKGLFDLLRLSQELKNKLGTPYVVIPIRYDKHFIPFF